MKQTNKILLLIFLAFIVIWYLLHSIKSANEFLRPEEMAFYKAAKSLAQSERAIMFYNNPLTCHPLGHTLLLGGFLKVFGISQRNCVIFGIVCFLLSLFFVYKIGELVGREYLGISICGVVSLFFYALNPYAIKGSTLVDIDTATLNLAILAIFFFFIRYKENKTFCYFILPILFAICLWLKITTTLVIPFIIALFFVLRGQIIRGVLNFITMFLIGGGIFLITWKIYADFNGYDFKHPFTFIITKTSEGAVSDLISKFRGIINFALWIGPVSFLVAIVCSIYSVTKFYSENKTSNRFDSIFIISALLLVVTTVYFIIGSIIFTFPKYHFPMVGFYAIVIAIFTVEALTKVIDLKKKIVIAICVVGVIYLCVTLFHELFVGDLLYTFNHKLKLAKVGLSEPIKNLLLKLALSLVILYTFWIALSFLLFKKGFSKNFIPSLLVCSIGMIFGNNSFYNSKQLNAKYSTKYCYGSSGLDFVVDIARIHLSHHPQMKILAVKELQYLIFNEDETKLTRDFNLFDISKKDLPEIFSNPEIQMVIFGFGENTLSQYKCLTEKKEVVEILNTQFEKLPMNPYSDSYIIWRRIK